MAITANIMYMYVPVILRTMMPAMKATNWILFFWKSMGFQALWKEKEKEKP